MSMNISRTAYVPKSDITSLTRYHRLIDDPIGKARLMGKSWELYEHFLSQKKPQTRYIYLRYFLQWLEWLDWDSEQLFNEFLKMTRADDPREVSMMMLKLSKFQDDYAEKRGITDASASNIYNAVKGFFKANSLHFEYYVRDKHTPQEMTNISKEQIRKVLKVTGSPKVISMIYFAKDSGLRISDLVALPIWKIRAVLDDRSKEYHLFEWFTIKTGEKAFVIIGPEGIKHLRDWMRYRVDILGISAEDEDPVFCASINVKGYVDYHGTERVAAIKGDIMYSGGISSTFRGLVIKAGLKPLPGNNKLPSIHSLRKFHQTALESVGIPQNWICQIQGRKGTGSSKIYSKPTDEELIEAYRRAYPALSLTETVQETEIPKLTALNDRLRTMENQIAQMRETYNIVG